MIALVDYGMSNLRSVSKAVERLGADVRVTSSAQDVAAADKVILPGVGAFGDAMQELNRRGLDKALNSFASSGKPFLGICLGLQLLFDESEENPGVKGLALIRGKVVRFPARSGLKVPHMGWNQLRLSKSGCRMLEGVSEGAYVYFVHSYYACPADREVVLAETEYGVPFTAMAWSRNVYGAQFHPEKSQEVGLKILENFVRI